MVALSQALPLPGGVVRWIWLLPLLLGCAEEPSTIASKNSDGGGGEAGTAPNDGSAGSGGSAGEADALPPSLCGDAAGDVLGHGGFDEGMDGDAPAFWQVRDPNAPSACSGSGQPSEHVFLTETAPGCSGQALAIDSRGQWDCYAVQRASDYDTIEGGATYRVSAVVRSSGNSENPAAWFVLGVQWLDASDQFFGDEKNPETASASENDYEWKLLSFELVAPPNARRVLVWLSAHYPGRVDFDNVRVEKL